MKRFKADKHTVVDTSTGLMWVKNAGLMAFPLTWQEALDGVKELNKSGYNGFKDWKLPNRRELFSLMSHEKINPSLPEDHPFDNVFAGYYWTSTTCARLPDQAWYLHLGGAKVYRGMKHGSYLVWPVRVYGSAESPILPTLQKFCYDENGKMIDCRNSGQDGEFQTGFKMTPAPRFEVLDEVIKDRVTGLSWTRQANSTEVPLDWESAFEVASQMNDQKRHGYRDWRVPTVRELEGLTDMDRHSPSLPQNHPFSDVQEFYWSATTSMYNPDYAWVLYMKDGAIGVGHKRLPEFYLWLVRG